ncbi:MAG: hypothetical protein KDD70_13505, partial [Bdellovibrionales bacterium]|nr:hypothetical protein [Bdellovibrionales bacterium]
RSAEHGQTESMSSALRARVQLRAGESQPFKFKASDAPERDSSGKVSSRVKLISGKILREE